MLYSSHSLVGLGTINLLCLYIRFEAAQIRRGRFQMLTSPWGLQENSPVLCEDGRVLCTVGVTYREVETADLSHGIARMARRSQNDPSALVAAPIVRTACHLSSQTGAIMDRRKEKAAAHAMCTRGYLGHCVGGHGSSATIWRRIGTCAAWPGCGRMSAPGMSTGKKNYRRGARAVACARD